MKLNAAVAGVCLMALLVGAETAQSQSFGRNKVHYDRLDFRVLQTEHFDIHFYAEEEEATWCAATICGRLPLTSAGGRPPSARYSTR